MENNVPFDILCGECRGNLKRYENNTLKCEICGKETDAEFVKNFLNEKYVEKIMCMEIINDYSARIYFKDL